MDKRYHNRLNHFLVKHSIVPILKMGEVSLECSFVNLDYAGGCIEIPTNDLLPNKMKGKEDSILMDFKVGGNIIQRNVHYKICWEKDFDNSRKIGVEFLHIKRAIRRNNPRYKVRSRYAPRLICKDPLDPTRNVYFNIEDLSRDGFKASTSLSNKHILPGMLIENAKVEFVSLGNVEISFKIVNTRKDNEKNNLVFHVGCKVLKNIEEYEKFVRKFVYSFGSDEVGFDEVVEDLGREKELKSFISYKIVDDEDSYNEVLKLRYMAYKSKSKVAQGTQFLEMGEGLENEGTVFAGYLNGKLVSTFEVRAKSKGHQFWFRKNLKVQEIPGIKDEDIIEVNKLAIHPNLHSSDVIVGMFQKIHIYSISIGTSYGIISATDQLKEIYTKIGAKPTGIRVPHPKLQNTFLNILCISPEIHMNAKNINPYTWDIIYRTSYDFAVQLGLVPPKKRNLVDRTASFIYKELFELKNKKKNKNNHSREFNLTKNEQVLHPRWTEKHFSALVIKPYILAGDKLLGEDKISEILEGLEINREYFDKKTNWISVDFFDEFNERMAKYVSLKDLSEIAAKISISPEVLGEKYYLLKYMSSPKMFVKSVEDSVTKLNITRKAKVHFLGKNKIEVKIYLKDGYRLPKHRESTDNFRMTFYQGTSVILGSDRVSVEQTTNSYDGDECCTYVIKWKPNKSILSYLVMACSLVLVNGIAIYQGILSEIPSWNFVFLNIGVALFSYVFISLIKYFVLRNEFDELIREYESYQEDSREQYNQLQSTRKKLNLKVNELGTLLDVNNFIQNEEAIPKILQNALDSLRVKFSFTRAFIMLKDKEENALKVMSVISETKIFDDIWKFKVALTEKRDNPQVISSVFHSNKSAVINNVEESYFQLNEQSRKLIDLFGPKAFIIVPIPEKDKVLGVIIADKGDMTVKYNSESTIDFAGYRINENDQEILENIGRQLGIALSKQSKYDELKESLDILKKYNPGIFKKESLEQNYLGIGGYSKKFVCLFLDIRGFSQISEDYPAEIVVGLLNQVFEKAQKSIKDSGGIIDKFIGDEVFAIWDLNDTTDKNEVFEKSYAAATNLVKEIIKLNIVNTLKGLPVIRVGIGIDYGEVIRGNIGTEDRMDFTCIGKTVNRASRLQSLSKDIDSTIVLSENYYENLPKQLLSNWESKENVELRGVKEVVNIKHRKYDFYPDKLKIEENRDGSDRSKDKKGSKAA
ncbi:MAG: GAF domain-containing protein [Halobacteriovoraceae bacterium]|nr:GAF domain-containing protein [Halobacteriovoraceae bacterium]MCB9094081.1 GAF domain-containing protein [Halobacteriovoraceae bacterium]